MIKAKSNHTVTKTAVNGQLFVKKDNSTVPLNLEQIQLKDGATIQQKFNELNEYKKIVKLLKRKLSNKGYLVSDDQTLFDNLKHCEIVTRKKTAQKKIVQKLKDKGVI